ncbi:hypothetical protein GCM10025865_33900 (plasmid) [Paraoerskovia sediminicola]|uniref:Centromere-binding protein ParB C-terminal domain-containing protein n=1 Tax=Paraoerskovia sediminicola TaxID=1138587 RepID=A0ABM8G7B1_9CELL|nr:hypothetical protein [Paraoerskovia sediminicola]BDZ44046.1 hypothetical protein GCM10025865_33450 [Paraoerskovia sediminicola]BDZ44091.1 hypothetical protein GCM10025865_33900 [Paraoerskovia sediminicola]
MSETSERGALKLPARTARSASSLQRKNREASAPRTAPATPAQRETAPQAASPASRGRGVQVSGVIDPDVRAQARAAFRLLMVNEGTPTFSKFLENALAREIERAQRDYNGGEPFEPITENLRGGRPLGS